jgi:hypothetical protein
MGESRPLDLPAKDGVASKCDQTSLQYLALAGIDRGTYQLSREGSMNVRKIAVGFVGLGAVAGAALLAQPLFAASSTKPVAACLLISARSRNSLASTTRRRRIGSQTLLLRTQSQR